jgi:predicted alpha/beta-fold hydrolase
MTRTEGSIPIAEWSPFRPAAWLPGPHLQTAWSRFLRRGPLVEYRRETWKAPDGDTLELDWVDGPAESPLLLALHGLEGCSQSLYMQGILWRAARRGWRGVALNFRSCARPLRQRRAEPLPHQGRRLYHSGETSDLEWVVERLAEREPDLQLVVAGTSLGGNVLLKWLGERSAAVPRAVRSAVAISAPHDLAAASRHLMAGLGPLYMRFFLDSLKQKALAFDREWPGIVDVDGVRRARTFWEIDDAAVAPIHGFADAADYYARCSSIDVIDRIQVPTLVVNAADDPFIPGHVLSRVRARASAAVTCLFTRRGGHVGFVVGRPGRARSWAEDRAIEFLADRLEAAGLVSGGEKAGAEAERPGAARRDEVAGDRGERRGEVAVATERAGDPADEARPVQDRL